MLGVRALDLRHGICTTRGAAAFTGGARSLEVETPKVEPPKILPESVDRRLYRAIHGLPHTAQSDRYVTALSDLGEGLGWVAAGAALAWLGGAKGRRAGLAMSVAALGTTYLIQRLVKP